MKRKSLFLVLIGMLFLFLMQTGVFAEENYGVWIGDTEITSANAADVFGDGEVSYDPETRKLTLDYFVFSREPKLTGNMRYLIYTDKELTIKVIGSNHLTYYAEDKHITGICASSLSLEGDGYLKVDVKSKGNTCAIQAGFKLENKGVHVTAKADSTEGASSSAISASMSYLYSGSLEASCSNGALDFSNNFIIDDAYIPIIKASTTTKAEDAQTVTLDAIREDCWDRTGQYKYVDISKDPDTVNCVWVGGVKVTSANAKNVLGNGKVSYDEGSRMLTFTGNPVISSSHNNCLIYADGINLTINAPDGLQLYGDSNTKGIAVSNGTLTIKGNISGEVGSTFISCSDQINVRGNLDLTTAGSTCISVPNSDFIMTGNLTEKTNGYGIKASSITIDGNVDIFTSNYSPVLYTEKQITVVNGTWNLESNYTVILAVGGIVIPDTHEIALPANGSVKNSGYYDYIYDNDKSEGATKVTIQPIKVMNFTDVKSGAWFYEYVDYVFKRGIMSGMSDTVFGSSTPIKRSHFAVMMYRLEDEPEVTYTDSLTDVQPGKFYTNAIMWTNKEGIMTGYDFGAFGINDNLTREQMVTVLFRYAKYKGLDVSKSADFGSYKDAKKVSKFATEAMEWAIANGIITGKAEGTMIDPTGNAVRAEAATIFTRFMKLYGL